MTNYEPNEINWAVGDIVIHDADEKSLRMIMRVIGVCVSDGQIKTRYVNRDGAKPYYLNHKNVLHDPARFGIDTRVQSFSKDTCAELKLYIWTDFCPDHTAGLAFAIAETVEEAKRLISVEHGSVCVWDWGTLTIKDLEKCARCVEGGGY